MYTEAIECWKFIVESGMSTNPETYNNWGVCYFIIMGLILTMKKLFIAIKKIILIFEVIGDSNFRYCVA